MIKILFLINSLGGGGAERVLVNLVNNMNKDKFDITVETMFGDGINSSFLDSNVNYISKNKLHIKGLSKVIRFIPSRLLYKFYIGKRKYDIVVAYLHGEPVKVVSGCKDKNIKKVAWLHNGNPGKGTFFKHWKNEKTAIKAYADFDKIVGVSKSVSKAFTDYTNVSKNVITLYNTYDSKRILKLKNEPVDLKLPDDCPILCSIGRFYPEKGFDRLISVCALLNKEGFKFNLLILGDGPEEHKLKSLAKSLGIEKQVIFLGFCENPYAVMAKSDFYVLSSRQEGLATVLVEALFVGLPSVSTDVSGAKEVLGENNEYGLVVENSEEGIYDGIKRFLTDKELLLHYKNKLSEGAIRFKTEETVRKTEELFESLLGE